MAFNQVFGDENFVFDLWWTWRQNYKEKRKRSDMSLPKIPKFISLTPKGEDIVKESVGKFTKMGFLAIAVVALLATSQRS